jgi:hypothetical protein
MNFSQTRARTIFGNVFSIGRNSKIVAANDAAQNCTSSITFLHAIAPYVAIAYLSMSFLKVTAVT